MGCRLDVKGKGLMMEHPQMLLTSLGLRVARVAKVTVNGGQ